MQAEKGGALSSRSTNKQRLVLALAAGSAFVIAPFALLGASEAAPVTAGAAPSATHALNGSAVRHLSGIALSNNKVSDATTTVPPTAPPATTPVTVPPTTTPPTTAAPRFIAVAPPSTVPAGYSGRVAAGQATYYSTGPGSGVCASKVAPRGATVKVTNVASGAWITCVVGDYEESGWPRVIDLATADFGRLASLSVGVISVTISW